MAFFKVTTFNINHTQNFSGVLNLLKSEKPDLLFLQECGLETEQLDLIVRRLGYKGYSSLIDFTLPGVAVVYLETLPVSEILPLFPGRLLFVKINDWAFINIYAQSGNNNKQARHVLFNETIVRNLQLRTLIPVLIGDFNCCISEKDVESNYNNKKCESLARLINIFGYRDAYRCLYPDTVMFSYYKAGQSASRLDRAYLPERAVNILHSVEYLTTLSDHKAMTVTFNGQIAPAPERPQTYWKLNSNILKHPDFMVNFNDCWSHCLLSEDSYASVDLWWEDFAKPTIRKFLIRFAKMRAESNKGTKLLLFSALDKYIREGLYDKASDVRERLQSLITQESFGYTIQSVNKQTAEEERVSLYHVNNVFKNCQSSLKALKIGGVETTDPAIIEQEVHGFFGPLFNGQHRSCPNGGPPVDTGQPFQPDFSQLDEFTADIGQLDPAQAASLEGDITLDEYLAALDSCSQNKSPGLDGICYEFYSATKDIIGQQVVNIYNSQLHSGQFIKSFRQGVIKLVSKVKNVPTVSELRPLTLLNCDYKILSKILTTRINSILDTVLLSRQLCMKESENILFGVTDLISSISYSNLNNINSFLVSYDIFKAFDKTNVPFVLKVMEKMKFGPNFLFWIKSLYSNISTSFILPNSISEFIDILFSVRQGEGLAMPIFLINIEPLLLKLHSVLKGLKIGVVDQKEEGYVDDVSALSTDPNDLILIDNIFTKFEALSGTVLNRSNKCKIMGLGGWKGKTDWPLAWIQTVDSMKIYGIHFCPTIPATIKLSWQKCLDGFNSCLMSWKGRALPYLSQKAMILKTYATSKLWYLAQVLPIPKAVVAEIEKKLGSFLWWGRLERLELSELTNPVQEGGLGLPNIQARCDALFIKHLLRILSIDCHSRNHLLYWVGLRLRNMFPALVPPLRSEQIPPYFLHCVHLLEDKALDLDAAEISRVTTKEIYGLFNQTPPPPKIMGKRSLDWGRVWTRLNDPIICRESLDICFTLIHDIYPTKERLMRCNQHPDGRCPSCLPRTRDTAVHFFAECALVIHLWMYVKNCLIRNDIIHTILVDNESCLFFDIDVNSAKIKLYLYFISKFILFVHKNKHQNPTVKQLKAFFVHRKPTNLNMLI